MDQMWKVKLVGSDQNNVVMGIALYVQKTYNLIQNIVSVNKDKRIQIACCFMVVK